MFTSVLLKEKVNWLRSVIGGLAGSSIIWFYITPYAHLADHIGIKCGLSILMILLAFGFVRFKVFVKKLFTLYVITFMAGGALLGSHYLFNFQASSIVGGFAGGSGSFGDPLSWVFVIVGFPLAWHFTKAHVNGLELAKWKHDQRAEARVMLNGLSFELKGLVDTGNQLLDPLSGAPVAIVSISGRNEHFPDSILKVLNEDVLSSMNKSDDIPDSWKEKMRIIPCKVVGNNSQLLVAFKPDAFLVKTEGDYVKIHKCLVSFTTQPLSSDGLFDAILHPSMVRTITK